MKAKWSILAAAAVVGVLAAASDGAAQSARCDGLLAELRALPSGTAGPAGRIAALEKRSAAYGCSKSSLAGKPRECAGISAQLNQARRQAPSAGSDGRRRKVQAELARLRCGQAPAAPAERQVRRAPAPDARTEPGTARYVSQGGRLVDHGQAPAGGANRGPVSGIFALLFGGRATDDAPAATNRAGSLARLQGDDRRTIAAASRGSAEPGDKVRTYSRASFGGGSYRTLCVRTCDGYYFPISTVTSRANFERDGTVCRALCPGTEVSLYAHPVGSESERMHSVADGLSYEALPTAFQYRKVVDPACTCAFEAKLVVGADGSTAIDVDAIAAAYSPATTEAAAAIAAVTRAADAADGSLSPPGPAPGSAAALGAEAGGTPSAAPPLAAMPTPATDTRPDQDAATWIGGEAAAVLLPTAGSGPAASTPKAAALPAAGTPVAGAPLAGAPPAGAATAAPAAGATTAPAGDAAPPGAATSASGAPAAGATAAAVAAAPQGPGATAPRAAPVPVATKPALRVRTIGPAFLQNQ